jgi:Flp pilus assembly protein TadD
MTARPCLASSTPTAAAARRTWIVSPAWDLVYLVLTPLAIVPAVLLAVRHWLSPEQVYLAVISFASLGHHLPGFMRAYGDRELFDRFRWRFQFAPPLIFGLALLFTPPPRIATALGLPWTHLHGLELVLLLWGTWHGLMQTYGFMRIYDVRRGDNDRRTARLDHGLCVAIFVAGVVFSDTRMFAMAGAMWQSGLPLFGPEALAALRWVVGGVSVFVLAAYLANALQRRRHGVNVNAVKLLLAGVTGWFWWYCGRLSTNLLVGVAMFEIYHALQYNAIVWIYNRRLLTRAGERFGPLGFLFRDRLTMLGLYLGAIAAYSSIRYFTASPDDRMFGGDLASAHQWLIAAFVTSSLLHFYYDGFIWKVSESKTQQNLVDESIAAAPRERFTPGLVHLAKWGALAAVVGMLVAAERQFAGPNRAEREAAQRRALATLTPAVPEAAMLGSQEALARGDAATAAELARSAAAARPGSHQSQAELAWALMEAGDFAPAKDALEHAIELAPGHWQYHCDLGEACEQLDDLDRAQAEYLRAAKLAPKETEPLDRLATMLLRRNRIAAAVQALQRSIELKGDVAETHYRLGLAYLKQGNASRALAPLREATRLDAAHFQAWLQLGDALAALAEPDAAAAAYRTAVDLRPDVADARVGLADALLSSGQGADAESVLREGLTRTPDSPELALTLGVLLQQTGDQAEAQTLLRRASELGMNVGALNTAP